MQDARYFRARAAYVLDLADLISDRRAVGNLQALAADYIARAQQLETITVVPDNAPRDDAQK
jgi:hypothetical protein